MSDLNTMFNNGMGSYAAIQMGRQAAEEQQAAAQKSQLQQMLLQKQALENQQTQAMNPLEQMWKQNQINQQEAQLPGIKAQSQSLKTKADADMATAASNIAAEISKNKAQMSADDFKEMSLDAQKMVQSASLLEQVPAMQRPASLQKIASQYGIDEKSPFLQQFMEVPPENLPAALRTMGQGMAMASEKYITEMALDKQQQGSRREVAQIGANAQIESAKIAAASRENVSRNSAQARMSLAGGKPMSTDQKFAALSSIPEDERTPAEWQQLEMISKQRIAERSAGVNATTPAMLNLPNPMATAQAQSPVRAPQAQPQPTSAPAAPAGMKLIGTSKGRPVYQDAQGNRFIQ